MPPHDDAHAINDALRGLPLLDRVVVPLAHSPRATERVCDFDAGRGRSNIE
jgi:hypothetical protein